jgi:hypothetical protein
MLGVVRYGGWVRLREKATDRVVPEPRLRRESVEQSQEDYLPEELQQIYLSRQATPQPLGNRPLIVLGAGKRNQPPGTPDALWAKLRAEKDDQIRDLGKLSSNSKVIFDPPSGHAIHSDNPQLVARAIEEVLNSVQNATPLTP